MRLLSIDPGTTESAFVVLDSGVLIDKGKIGNNAMRDICISAGCDSLAIEMVASYGMAVGKSVFETCVWTGRFIEAFSGPHTKIYRKDVKIHLCQSMKAKDANIRQAIIDRYPETGGGRIPQIGTKKQPGPLYGVSNDIWAALAVGLYFTDTLEAGRG